MTQDESAMAGVFSDFLNNGACTSDQLCDVLDSYTERQSLSDGEMLLKKSLCHCECFLENNEEKVKQNII